MGFGHRVHVLTRDARARDRLRALGACVHQGSIADAADLRGAMAGVDAAVALAPALARGPVPTFPLSWRAENRRRVRTSAALTSAALQVGVPRVIVQSSSLLYTDGAENWIDERTPIDLTRDSEALVVAETDVERFGTRGGDGVILRFGDLIGAEPMSRWLLRRARAGQPTLFGRPDAWSHVLHMADAGLAVDAALRLDGGIYNVGVEPIRRHELAEAWSIAGQRRAGRLHHRRTPWLWGSHARLLSHSRRVSSDRFAKASGWLPTMPKFTQEWFDDLT